MKLTYALLAISCLPIVAVARVCLDWRPVDIQAVDRSQDGRLFGAVAPLGIHGYMRDKWEIREWSPDLSTCKTIHRFTANVADLAVSGSGSVVAYQSHEMVIAFDTAKRKTLWQTTQIPPSACGDLFFSADDRYVIAIEGDNFGRTAMSVLDSKDGRLIGNYMATVIIKVYTRGNFITVLDANHNRVAFTVVNGRLIEIPDEQVTSKQDFVAHIVMRAGNRNRYLYNPSSGYGASPAIYDTGKGIRLLRRTYDNAATIEIVDPGSLNARYSYQAAYAEQNVGLWRFALSIAVAAWVFFLLLDGQHSKRPWRVLVDLTVVVALLNAVCVNLYDDAASHVETVKSLIITISAIFCLLFWALIYNRRKFYVLVAGFIACAATTIAPCIVYGLILWFRGYRIHWNDTPLCGPEPPSESGRKQSGSRFRIGIREMLLFTSFAAVFIAMGVHLVVTIGFGVAIAVLMMVGSGLGFNRVLARLSCCLCILGLVLVGSRWSRYSGTWFPMMVFMIIFVFCFLGSYGFQIRRLPRANPADNAAALPA